MIEFMMPSLGADMEDGTLTEWLVKPGDKVKRGDIIAEVDTQKGLIEIEVFDEGTIDSIITKEGEKVPVGTVMAMIAPADKQQVISEKTEVVQDKVTEEKKDEEKTHEKAFIHDGRAGIKISPLARKIAEAENIDYTQIKGTGPEGSIVQKDLKDLIGKRDKVKSGEPEPTEEKRDIDTKRLRSAIAAAMRKSNAEIPHFYLETKVDMSKALDWLKESNAKKTIENRMLPIVLIIKAMASALKEVPEINAIWENDLVLKNEINIGFVISLRQGGVVVPAIKDADQKSLEELMELLNELIPRAKKLKLRSSELSNTTVTLTNIGDGSVEKMFGIIYPPQVAIVGIGTITEEPWAENKALSVRPVVTITLAADHRALDGRIGSKFLLALKNNIQNPESL